MQFGFTATVFSDTSRFDALADMEQRVAALEATIALTGTQHAENAQAGTVTLAGTTPTEVLRIPDALLTAPGEGAIMRINYEFDLLWTGAPVSPAIDVTFDAGTPQLNGMHLMRVAYSGLGGWEYIPGYGFMGFYAVPGYIASIVPAAVRLGYPTVLDMGGYAGPLNGRLKVNPTASGGTASVRNAKLNVDIL